MANKTLTITALNKYIKYLLSNDSHLKNIEVTGEISNYTPHHSKHMYFTLKDDDSRIDSVMFAANANKVDFPVKNGDKVIVKGYIDVYPPTGKYQLYATKIELDGIGDLTVKFEKLKEKLKSEGLFDRQKKTLPKFPKKIGVITATSGAAIRDIVSTIEKRYRLADVYIFRTVVQGENGKDSIINSLNIANKYDLDVVIIGRGGGSIEDLWNFNEEEVIRKIGEFDVPIISGVGHETDFTLCDFVCDIRAETPTAAAVLATPNTEDILSKFDNVDELIRSRVKRVFDIKVADVNRYSDKYLNSRLNSIIRFYEVSFVNEFKRLDDLLNMKVNNFEKQYRMVVSKNLGSILNTHIIRNKHELNNLQNSVRDKYINIYDKKQYNFEKTVAILEQVSPLKILSRGYSVSYSNEKIVKSVDDIGNNLNILVADGEVSMEIVKKEVKKNGRSKI
ncbi:MAG: exodeoxyribonuclease VII large subunit [Bacilli bacterium]